MICEKNKCYGCFACYNICPKNAIKMIEDEYGYIYPQIDKKICVNCGLCKKVCPAISKEQIEFQYPKKAMAAFSKNVQINKTSSSGGVAYEMYKYIINNNGICYGVSSKTNNSNITFIRVDNKEDLEKLQGSKYTHAYINDEMKSIKKDILEGKNVLFIGTPCQIAGLKKFLGREYDNLICVDIICHGVPSQKLLKEEIQVEFDEIKFRGENGFRLIAKKDKKEVYSKSKNVSYYYIAFLNGINYRENCYSCEFAQNSRISDLTIGDFWGLKDKKIINKNGISLILINSEKGQKFIEKIDNISVFEENIESALKSNEQLNEPTTKTKKTEIFRKQYINKGLKKTISKVLRKKIIIGKIKEYIKRIIK